ncbi:MAG: hypothetical protein AAFZ15_32610 [Bacteroidota bacterium]
MQKNIPTPYPKPFEIIKKSREVIYPKLRTPCKEKLRKISTFKPLTTTAPVMEYLPHTKREYDPTKPRRKSLDAPMDNNTFVKPIKQCFIRNPRTMPMTRIMLTLLSGWAGQGRAIETTIGTIAKKLERSRRQVFRYLKDALEEGYLSYCRTTDRIGRYTGIKVWLNFAAIRFRRFRHKTKKAAKPAEILEVTDESEINSKITLKKDMDKELWIKLESFAKKAGYSMPELLPS